MTCGPGSPGTRSRPWSPSWPYCAPGPVTVVGYATRIALRELGRRAEFPGGQLDRLDDLIGPLVTGHSPGLLALYGVGTDTAALLLVAAGDHPERLRSEAARAHLCAAAPIPASSGKTVRHRPSPGGDRQASHALWRIVITADELPRSHPRLRQAAHRAGPVEEGDHALPQAVRRPRGLPAPPHRRLSTLNSGDGLTL